jgi:hypothetical protein
MRKLQAENEKQRQETEKILKQLDEAREALAQNARKRKSKK